MDSAKHAKAHQSEHSGADSLRRHLHFFDHRSRLSGSVRVRYGSSYHAGRCSNLHDVRCVEKEARVVRIFRQQNHDLPPETLLERQGGATH